MSTGLALACLTASPPTQAVTPYLVEDIDQAVSPASSDPRGFQPLRDLALFTAVDTEGSGLWRSNGTEAGTFPLLPGCDNCRLHPEFQGSAGGRTFLAVITGEGHAELWVTGGRPRSTFRLADFSPGSGATGPGLWVPGEGRFYFTADDGVHGLELWTSDGTAAGTNLVADLTEHEIYAPVGLTSYRGAVYFGTWDGDGILWKTDGTAAGTVPVKRFPGFLSEVRPRILGVAGGQLVLTAFTPKTGIELWASDGTGRGTFLLADLAPGRRSTVLEKWVKAGERIFLVADAGGGQNLFVTDGTARRTRKLTGFRTPQPFGPFGGFPSAVGNRLFFPADDGRHGRELWTSDGTLAGTRLLRDGCPGPCAGEPLPLAAAGGQLFFHATDEVHGVELWASDGTTAGTRLVRDLCPGICSSFPLTGVSLGGAVLVAARDGADRPQLWRSDGTAAGTVLLAAFAPTNLWNPAFQGTATSRLVLFTGEDAEHGRELWRSDGTPAGTFRVKDIATADLGGSDPGGLRAAGDRLLFFADDGVEKALWRSDGTAAGTTPVLGFGAEASLPPTFLPAVDVAGTLFLIFDPDFRGLGLWKSDGTAAGTVRLTPEGVGSFGQIGALGGEVFFVGVDGSHGPALWKTDGTLAGTVPVDPVDWSGGTAQKLTPFAGRLYYFLASGENRELWSTDGTREGTTRLADLHAGVHDGNPPLLAEAGGRLYFFAAEEAAAGQVRLWSTDGTPAGTRQVATFGLAPGDTFSPAMLAEAGGRIFFSGSVVPEGGAPEPAVGLWVSDGTEAGTRLLADILVRPGFLDRQEPLDFALDSGHRLVFAGPVASGPAFGAAWVSDGTAAGTAPLLDADGREIVDPRSFRTFAGQLVFAGRGTDDQVALWQSDGTAAGTRRVMTLGPPGRGHGDELTVAGDRLYFKAHDPAVGVELWALRPD